MTNTNSIDTNYFLIRKIEAALGFKLYENQIKYILGEIGTPKYDCLRGTGKTTSYCIKLALSYGEPLRLNDLVSLSDAQYSGLTGSNAINYSKGFFVHEFMRIREKLKDYGFPVREVRYDMK